MTQMRVELVAVEELPAGHDWCLVEVPTRGVVGFFREDRFCPEVVAQAWEALATLL